MTAEVVALHADTAAAEQALAKVGRYLDRCKLAANTVKAYRRQCAAYVTWLGKNSNHPSA